MSRGGDGRKTTDGQTALSGRNRLSIPPTRPPNIKITNHVHSYITHHTSHPDTYSMAAVTMVLPPSLRRIVQARFLAEAILLISLLLASSSSLAASAFSFHCENALRPRQISVLETHQHHISSRRGSHHHRKTLQRYSSPYPDDDAVLLIEEKEEEYDAGDDEILVGPINGTIEGYVVTQQYHVPIEGFPGADGEIDSMSLTSIFSSEDMSRLQLKANNVTLAAALMLLDPEKYPTQSRARKAIR